MENGHEGEGGGEGKSKTGERGGGGEWRIR